jgi:hypothetical protein
MKSNLRKGDFKLGVIHGRIKPERKDSEAKIQRNVYLCQSIKIRRSNDDRLNSFIRLFAYEMPLGYGRNYCVDLVGYDVKHNLYLIELKKGSSSEVLSNIIKQINGYANRVAPILKDIEKDFQKTFYLPLEFKEIKKVILAPREFYKGRKSNDYKDNTIEYLYFRDKDIQERKIGRTINVHKVKFKIKS